MHGRSFVILHCLRSFMRHSRILIDWDFSYEWLYVDIQMYTSSSHQAATGGKKATAVRINKTSRVIVQGFLWPKNMLSISSNMLQGWYSVRSSLEPWLIQTKTQSVKCHITAGLASWQCICQHADSTSNYIISVDRMQASIVNTFLCLLIVLQWNLWVHFSSSLSSCSKTGSAWQSGDSADYEGLSWDHQIWLPVWATDKTAKDSTKIVTPALNCPYFSESQKYSTLFCAIHSLCFFETSTEWKNSAWQTVFTLA